MLLKAARFKKKQKLYLEIFIAISKGNRDFDTFTKFVPIFKRVNKIVESPPPPKKK